MVFVSPPLLCGCILCPSGTVLKGVPNNLEFLRRLVTDPRFIAGDTTTKFLEGFHFTPRVMEVILPGMSVCVCGGGEGQQQCQPGSAFVNQGTGLSMEGCVCTALTVIWSVVSPPAMQLCNAPCGATSQSTTGLHAPQLLMTLAGWCPSAA